MSALPSRITEKGGLYYSWGEKLQGLKEGMAESEGFEPPIDLRLCLISSQVHSTGLCQLSAHLYFISGLRLAAFAAARPFVDLS